MARELRLALLISGGGTTMEQIILASRDGRLHGVTPSLIVASNQNAGGIEKAKRLGIKDQDILVIHPKKMGEEMFVKRLLFECAERRVNFVGQYGWMPKTPEGFIKEFKGDIVNQHPGPLHPGRPDFGGKGMYGMRVHCARLLYVRARKMIEPWTEVCCHRVDPEYDHGAVLVSRLVPIHADDVVESLKARALPIEHDVQIQALKAFAAELPFPQQARVDPVPPEGEYILEDAKRVAKLLYPKG